MTVAYFRKYKEPDAKWEKVPRAVMLEVLSASYDPVDPVIWEMENEGMVVNTPFSHFRVSRSAVRYAAYPDGRLYPDSRGRIRICQECGKQEWDKEPDHELGCPFSEVRNE